MCFLVEWNIFELLAATSARRLLMYALITEFWNEIVSLRLFPLPSPL